MKRYNKLIKYQTENKEKSTRAERMLSSPLRKLVKDYLGVVKEQYIISPYIIDFFITTYGIAIELEGGIHNQQVEYDSRRERFLEELGILVIRLDNEYVENYLSQVISLIQTTIIKRQCYNHIHNKLLQRHLTTTVLPRSERV